MLIMFYYRSNLIFVQFFPKKNHFPLLKMHECHYKEAITVLDVIIEKIANGSNGDSDNLLKSTAYYIRGVCFEKSNFKVKALNDFIAAFETDPTSCDAFEKVVPYITQSGFNCNYCYFI